MLPMPTDSIQMGTKTCWGITEGTCSHILVQLRGPELSLPPSRQGDNLLLAASPGGCTVLEAVQLQALWFGGNDKGAKERGENKKKKWKNCPPFTPPSSQTHTHNNKDNKTQPSPCQPDWKSGAAHRGPPTTQRADYSILHLKRRRGRGLLGSANEDWVAGKHNRPPSPEPRGICSLPGDAWLDKFSAVHVALSTRAQEAGVWGSLCTRFSMATAAGDY